MAPRVRFLRGRPRERLVCRALMYGRFSVRQVRDFIRATRRNDAKLARARRRAARPRETSADGRGSRARTRASLFRVELSRGAWVAEQMLGPDSGGVLVTDFYSVYTSHDDWNHAYCGAHLVREAKKIAECFPGPRSEELRDRICAWYVDAKKAQTRQRRR